MASLLRALLAAIVFAGAALWSFDLGYRVAGAWLGMLMGFQAGIFAVLMLSGVPGWFARASRLGERDVETSKT